MLKSLNESMDYIECHLLEADVIERAIRRTGVSAIHYKSIFAFLSGMTIHDYVRKRRLSCAGQDLLAGATVTDVAFAYGYQSLDGFSRAFKAWNGALPSELSKLKSCAVFPKMRFSVTATGGDSMECRIVEMPAFRFAGVSRRVPMQFEGVNQAIVELAQSISPEQREEMHRVRNLDPREVVNVSFDADADFLREEGCLTHVIGVLTTEEQVGEGLETFPMQEGTWAVFPNEGPFPHTMQSTMARIYSEWFMTADYELARSLSFSFTKMNEEKADYAYSEIWIPVVRK